MNKFFGYEVEAPWPKFPDGRLPKSHHMTILFLGNVDHVGEPPLPPKMGQVCLLDRFLFLSNVVAYHVTPLTGNWDYPKKLNPEFMPHVTVARKPFSIDAWTKIFRPLPMITKAFHLYQSEEVLTTIPLIHPFEEIPHTADIAFKVRGESIQDIYMAAQAALMFHWPELTQFLMKDQQETLDDIIIALNKIVTKADQTIGAPFKAVSFHGEIRENEWEMIVDV